MAKGKNGLGISKKSHVTKNASGKKARTGGGTVKSYKVKTVKAPKKPSQSAKSWGSTGVGSIPKKKTTVKKKAAKDASQTKTLTKKVYKKTYGSKAYKGAKKAGRTATVEKTTSVGYKGKKGNRYK